MARATKQQRGSAGERGLRGKRGARGPRGERGLTGKTGERGLAGKAGQRGVRGKTGASGPVHITRAELEKTRTDIRDSVRTFEIQFRRMADMQAEVDVLKRVVERLSDKLKILSVS